MGSYNNVASKVHVGTIILIFGYLKRHLKRRIICDTISIYYLGDVGIDINWLEIYPDSIEELPPDMLDPKVNTVSITTFLYAYHSHDLETRRYVFFPDNCIQYPNPVV